MLHLLPILWILRLFVLLVGGAVLAATYAGWFGGGDAVRDAETLMRWSATIATGGIVALFAAWRQIPVVQRWIFPYLGGRWSGVLEFLGPHGLERRQVTLEITHTLFGLRILLDSAESTSRTLVVHAERDPDFHRFRLFYVYLNDRKEGVVSAGEQYRGLSIIRVVGLAGSPELHGDYFTETHRRGTLHFTVDKLNPWWMLWR
jgi:hypothetical protein